MLFYDLMNYNYPDDKKYFKINPHLTEETISKPLKKRTFSSNINQQKKIIKKYQKIFKYLPFIEAVYVCNSVSFKSIHQKSDIDLFIITSNNFLHLGRLITKIVLKLFKIESTHQPNKFCTGFWITESYTDLYPLSIFPIDLYLAYWIAHLQPIYARNTKILNKVFKDNIWVKQIIPNYNYKAKNIIGVNPILGENFIKKIGEKLIGFNFLNKLIGYVRIKIMKKKQKPDMIITNNILKFYSPDKRKIVYLKYKTLKPHYLQQTKNKDWRKTKIGIKKNQQLFENFLNINL